MTTARNFAAVASLLVWAAGTYWWGWLAGLVVSVIAYPVALLGCSLAHFACGVAGDMAASRRERRRSR